MQKSRRTPVSEQRASFSMRHRLETEIDKREAAAANIIKIRDLAVGSTYAVKGSGRVIVNFTSLYSFILFVTLIKSVYRQHSSMLSLYSAFNK